MISVLLIGAGPSYRNKLDLARNFKGIKVVPAALAKTIMEEGITPDYITQYEIDVGLDLARFPPELAKTGIPIVYNFMSKPPFLRHLSKHKFKSIPFFGDNWYSINNVGLFSAYFAREHLKATKIYLIGFDHCGMDYHAKTYLQWVENFKVFVDMVKDECKIINCTGTGKLYMKGIIDGGNLTTFN